MRQRNLRPVRVVLVLLLTSAPGWMAPPCAVGEGPHGGKPRRAIEVVFFDLGETLVTRQASALVLMPGAEETVRGLAEDGVRLGVITDFDGDRAALEQLLGPQIAPLLSRFETVVISSEVGVRKPDPEIFRAAAGRLADPPEPRRIAFVTESIDHLGDRAEEPTRGARALGWLGIVLADGPSDPRADHTVSPADLTRIRALVAAADDG